MVELVWETVPHSRSSGTKAAVSELDSCAWLQVGSCVGRSESRTTAGLCNCLNTVCQVLWRPVERVPLWVQSFSLFCEDAEVKDDLRVETGNWRELKRQWAKRGLTEKWPLNGVRMCVGFSSCCNSINITVCRSYCWWQTLSRSARSCRRCKLAFIHNKFRLQRSMLPVIYVCLWICGRSHCCLLLVCFALLFVFFYFFCTLSTIFIINKFLDWLILYLLYVRLFANQGNMTDIQRDREKQTIRQTDRLTYRR